MLNIDENIKTAFLTDSTTKELTIESDGLDITKRNFCGSIAGAGNLVVPQNPSYGGSGICEFSASNGDITNSVAVINSYTYGCLSVDFCFTNIVSAPTSVRMILYEFSTESGWEDTSNPIAQKVISVSDYTGTGYDDTVGFYITFNTSSLNKTGKYRLAVYNDDATTLECGEYFNHPMLSFGDDLSAFPYEYVDPSTQEPWDDSMLNQHNIFINNDHLLSESFSLNESLCSEENIKFGLCEAAYCQFTVTDDYHDFRDRIIKPKIKLTGDAAPTEAELLRPVNLFAPGGPDDTTSWPHPGTTITFTWNNWNLNTPHYPTSQMRFDVSEDAKTYYSDFNFIRVTFECKLDITAYTTMPSKVLFFPNVRLNKLNGAKQRFWSKWSDAQFTAEQNFLVDISDVTSGFVTVSYDIPIDYVNYYAQFGSQYVTDLVAAGATTLDSPFHSYQQFVDANGDYFTSGTITYTGKFRNVQINYIVNKFDSTPVYDATDCVEFYGNTLENYMEEMSNIPLGVFTVNSIKKNYTNDILKQEITAYDKLTLLEQNAADWYTQYMFGIDFMDDTSNMGFTFARQIYSTYYNFIKTTGIDILTDADYEEDVIWSDTYNISESAALGTPKVQWRATDTTEPGTDWNGNRYTGHKDSYINYISHTINNPDVNKLYRVRVGVDDEQYGKLETIKERLPYYTEYFDSLFRGLDTGNVLIEQTRSSGIDGICVNSGDYFMLAPDCTSVTIYAPVCIQESRNYYPTGWSAFIYNFTYFVQIFATTENVAPDLSNGHIRLLYYNYGNKEIFACDSSITGRDVVRSLLEVNGCFYRLNRHTGIPEFIYCNKSGLYPRNDLYPADDLYPRLGSNETINMSQYQSFIQEDYIVRQYGRIQILKNITSNQTKSVVEWEYTGDADFKNSYLIEDNIFYCNDKMEYDYDNMPEVAELLANMWMRISNMDYVPCILKCIGMPWMECGDRIGVLTKTGGAETFVFHRTLTGIQSLIDTFESEGDEYNREVKDYGYKESED